MIDLTIPLASFAVLVGAATVHEVMSWGRPQPRQPRDPDLVRLAETHIDAISKGLEDLTPEEIDRLNDQLHQLEIETEQF